MKQPPIASTSSERAAPCHSRVRRVPFGQASAGYYQQVGYGADDVPGRFALEVTAAPARLSEIRHRVAEWLATIDVDEQVGTDVVLTVNEACTNCNRTCLSRCCGGTNPHRGDALLRPRDVAGVGFRYVEAT